MLTLLIPAVTPVAAQVPPADEPLTDQQIRDQELLLKILQDPASRSDYRRDAAMSLFERDRRELNNILLGLLHPEAGDPTTKRFIAQGIAGSAVTPPSQFAPALFEMLPTAKEPLLSDLAAALGRFATHPVADEVVATALDPEMPESVRRSAIAVLVHYRTQAAAGTLIELTGPGKPQAIRDAAFAALSRLTGLTEYEKDKQKEQRWRLWWRDHKDLSKEEWFARLINNFAQRHQQLLERQRSTETQLVQKQRQLFRATPPEGRPEMLRAMLKDPIEGLRQEALELTLQMRVDGGQVSPELRAAVQEVLDDESPALRASAARLLRELADDEGAKRIAARLASGEEQNPAVLKEYLAMMAKLPQPGAVEPVHEMLADPRLRVEAASALAAAADRAMVDAIVADRAAARIRQQLSDEQPPDPAIIRLLGRIGNGEDWQRIAGWLDHGDPAVREAAARVWAESPNQPLTGLTPYMDDPLVRSLVIAAAARRGREPATMQALIRHRPGADEDAAQLRQAWEQALVSMAERLPPEAVLSGYEMLKESAPAGFLGDMLTGAIDQLMTRRATGGIAAADAAGGDMLLCDLLLARGTARRAAGEPQQAVADYERIAALDLRTTATQRRQMHRGIIGVYLETDDVQRAAAAAEVALGPPQSRDLATLEFVAGIFLAAADRRIENGQGPAAQPILQAVTRLMGQDIPLSISRQITMLRARINAENSATGTGP